MKEGRRVLIALVAGLAGGIVVSASHSAALMRIADALAPLGTLWVNAIRMTVIPLVVSLLVTGVASASDIAQIGRLLAGRCCVFAGPSGAGKSSLVNRVLPGVELRTGEISRTSGKGRHTTTAAQLVRLPSGGGHVIDTPGVKAFGMLGADVSGDPTARTPADNQTVRNVFVIGPDKKVKLILAYPMTTGRNFDEVLRVIDSLQLTAGHKVSTPVNWRQGEDVIIAGSVSDEQARQMYPEGWKAPRPYIRIVPQPS